MAVRAGGAPCLADFGNGLSLFNRIPFLYQQSAVMAIKRLNSICVLKDDTAAVSSVCPCQDYFSVCGCKNRCSRWGRDINAGMERTGLSGNGIGPCPVPGRYVGMPRQRPDKIPVFRRLHFVIIPQDVADIIDVAVPGAPCLFGFHL